MPPTGPGERAILLPWFWPDAASFHVLAESRAPLSWSAARADPGLLTFLLTRDVPLTRTVVGPLRAVDLRAAADSLGHQSVPWADWSDPSLRPVTRTAVAAAHFAELVAETVGGVDPVRAWSGAWLAFAGWLAVGVIDPPAISRCLANPGLAADPTRVQVEAWGARRADVAWRLSACWPVPHWARVVLGRLDAAPAEVEQFGGDRQLQAVVQTAVVLAEQVETRLYVADEFDLAAALGELRLRSPDLDRVRARYAAEAGPAGWLDRKWTDPRRMPGLAARLREAADRVGDPTVRVDVFAERVQAAKMAALAEFAAGAGHEINNPLAVISGQSQYLLKHESDESRRNALQSIVRQTRRVHAILTELMYFARPPARNPERIEVDQLVREAAATVAPLAAERGVDIETGGLVTPLWLEADPKQLMIALTALIRNGVEAAPPGGWVRITTTFRPDRVDLVIEDSGPGPDERAREHLFDPFYSGRSAGRGRGLGLPAAWRLAREHGGDVRYVPIAAGPTRFLLTLPATTVVSAGAQRRTA